jgi:hypothetical protein
MLAIRQSVTRHISNLIIKLYIQHNIEAVAKLQFSTANLPGKCFGSLLADKTRDCCKTPISFATGSISTSLETIVQSVLLAVVYIIISFFTASIVFAALLFILFFIADTAAIFFTNIGFNGTHAHLRFTELPIRLSDVSKRHIPFSTIIFLFFSCIAASVSFFSTKTSALPAYEPAPIKKTQTEFEKINAESWQRHYEFQKNFSFTKINTQTDVQNEKSGLENDTASTKKTVGEADNAQYMHYLVAENGLISGAQPLPKTPEQEPLSPYPLTALIETIENPKRLPHIQSSGWLNILWPVFSCLLLSITFAGFSLLIRRKKSVFCL